MPPALFLRIVRLIEFETPLHCLPAMAKRPAKSSESDIVYWHRIAEHDDRHVTLVGCRVRSDVFGFSAIFAFIAVWEAFAVFLFVAVCSSKEENHQSLLLPLAVIGLFFVVGMCVSVWLARQLPSMTLTRIELQLVDKTTELTYCGRFRRQNPALPSTIDISSHASKSNCYTGVTSLIFENRRTRIPLLYTNDWYDTDSDAERHAVRAASEIAGVLHLKPPPEPAND